VPRTAVYAGSGLLTFGVYYLIANRIPDQWQTIAQLLTGIPFGLALLVRSRRPAALVVLLDSIAWVAAYRLALWLAVVNPYFGTAMGGLLGGLCVSAATRVYSRRLLPGSAFTGAVCGLPFGLIFTLPDAYTTLILAVSFPLWQIAVGLWIDRHAAV
jgi:hypothetical protein